ELGQYASVQLFTLRVQQRLPEFHLTVQNQQKIGHICYLVGGVPLGIELAAQLYVEQGVAVLDQLIAEIEQMDPLEPPPTVATVGMDHLQTAAIDLPARQRSIRAVFLHSWQLLTPAEQELLRHCAIFRGGFTRDAVLTVANGNGANLMALVMKSLVRRDSHDRYDLHELVRQYVIDEFQQAPRLVYATAQKHARYFTNFLAGQEEKLLQEWPFYQTVQTEIYNIRAAWTWCVDQREFTELERCVICLFIYLRYAGQVHEALTLATQAMASLDPLSHGEEAADSNSRLLGHLLIYAASAGIGAGLRAESEEWLQKAVQLGAALADPSLLGQIHATLMIKYSLNLENRRSFSHAEQALHWVNVGNTHHLQPIILRVLAIGLARQGKIAESFQVAAELQQLIERRHYHCIVGESYFLASTIHEIQRDWEAELLTAQQGWDLYREGGTRFGLDNLEGNLIWAHLQLGNFAQARELAMGFGSRARRTGKQAELLYSLQSLGHAAIGLGDEQAGTAYLTDALKLAVAIDNPFRRVQIRQQLGDLNLRQGDYTQAAIHFADALQCAQALEAFDLQLLAQAGLALTHLHQGHLMQAQRMIEPVLAAEHTLTPDSPDYAFIGLAAYHILAAHEDPRATAILDDLYAEVQLQAAKIKNDAQRKAFLGKIAEHRQIVALWTEKESNRQFI
ncbi:MAG: hypothetical protein KDE19_07170, partial [Caldilineaceae bacterium]|nr:hypothetical protein [Caldilineaceae bacterium]